MNIKNTVEQVRWAEDFCFKKRKRKILIHHNGVSTIAELLIRINISVNQLSVHGAITDWCEEPAQQISDHLFSSTERPVAIMNDESESRTSTSCQSQRIHFRSVLRYRETCCEDKRKHSKNFRGCSSE